jgi:glycosyltransferase involved in cell wall biosynthesis
MKDAINDKLKLKEYSKNSFNYAKSLSWSEVAQQYLKVYKKVLKGSKKPSS